MKKYLFGLGAMIVGAGLTFVLMHGEVSAKVFGDQMSDKLLSNVHCEDISVEQLTQTIVYCKIKDLTCVINGRETSCIRGNMF